MSSAGKSSSSSSNSTAARRSSSAGGCSMSALRMALVGLLVLAAVTNALECYYDINGVRRPDSDDEKVDVLKFERRNCSLNGGSVEKPCMTRTDTNGIVTRNCATINKQQEGCEVDKEGAKLCYCLKDLCNKAPPVVLAPSLTVASLLAILSLKASSWG